MQTRRGGAGGIDAVVRIYGLGAEVWEMRPDSDDDRTFPCMEDTAR